MSFHDVRFLCKHGATLSRLLGQAAGNTLWALAHMGGECLPPRVWNSLLPVVARGEQPQPEHLRQLFQVQSVARTMQARSFEAKAGTSLADTAKPAACAFL